MRATPLLLCCILFMAMSCAAPKKNTTMITYSDQNNNRYVITQTSFDYIPITEEESSSGTYHGGTPISRSIPSEKFNEIRQLALDIIASSPKNIKRAMLTSVVRVSENGTIETRILQKSKKRTSLETILTALKKS